MTLGELADGIVSVSYLSKIENLKTQASPEITQMLCNRLGIQVDSSEEKAIKEKCKQWYGMLFEVNDKEEITAKYKEIQELMDRNLSENLMMFEIHKIRYYLLMRDTENAINKINELNEISSNFDKEQEYYWYKFRGNYNSITGDFSQALYMYKQSEAKINHLNLDEIELADIQYLLSITNSKLRNTLEAIDYANKALEIYMKHYDFVRCAQCHNILGISYRRIRMYDKAIKNYNLALHLGKLNNNNDLIELTNQNLGHLYSVRGESEKAIKHFLEIINANKSDNRDLLTPLASVISEYYKVENYDEARKYVSYALKLFAKYSEASPYDITPYELCYYIVHTYNYLLNEEYQKFEDLVIKDFLPYLKKRKDFGILVIYSNLLADYYEKQHKYKDATKYYKEANFAYQQITNI